MNTPLFPSKNELQQGIISGITVLNDVDTYSNAEGSLWIGFPDSFSDQQIEDSLSERPEESSFFELSIDAFPYAVMALFSMLGINAEGLTRDQLIAELNQCSASNQSELDAINSLMLCLST